MGRLGLKSREVKVHVKMNTAEMLVGACDFVVFVNTQNRELQWGF